MIEQKHIKTEYEDGSIVLSNIRDKFTNELVSYTKVTTYADGSTMNDSKCDDIIYRKSGDEYYKRNFVGPLNLKWFGVIGDGIEDDSEKIQRAINVAESAQINSVIVPYTKEGYFLADSEIIIKTNVELRAEKRGAFRRITENYLKFISTKTSGAVVVMESHSTISNILFYCQHQKYSLDTDTESFNNTATIIQLGNPTTSPYCLGVTIEGITCIGFLDFMSQPEGIVNVEALHINGLYGMPLRTGFTIKQSYDICRVENIQWNLNSYDNILSGSVSNYYYKVGSQGVAFKLGRVDQWVFTNCFAYGVKHFAWFHREAYIGDNNAAGGASFIGCSADAVCQAFRIDRRDMLFDIKIIGGVYIIFLKVGTLKQAFVCFGPLAENSRVDVTSTAIQTTGDDGNIDYLFGTGNTLQNEYYHVFEDGCTYCGVTVAASGYNVYYKTALNYNISQWNYVKTVACSYARFPIPLEIQPLPEDALFRSVIMARINAALDNVNWQVENPNAAVDVEGSPYAQCYLANNGKLHFRNVTGKGVVFTDKAGNITLEISKEGKLKSIGNTFNNAEYTDETLIDKRYLNWYNTLLFVNKATYAAMISDGVPAKATLYSIDTDEDKSETRSLYLWKPDGNREKITTVSEFEPL